MSEAVKHLIWFEPSKLQPYSEQIYSLFHLPVKLSFERPSLLYPPEPPDPPDAPDPPPPSLCQSPSSQLASILIACTCSQRPMIRQGCREATVSSPSLGPISPDRKVSPVTPETCLVLATILSVSSPTLLFPQVSSFSPVDGTLDFYRIRVEYVGLVWIAGVIILAETIAMIGLPFVGTFTALVRILTARYSLPYVGSFTALVRILTAGCSLCFTSEQVSSLLEQLFSLVSSTCDLRFGLISKKDCYDNMYDVTTLPCIEVCFRQVLVTYNAKGLAPIISYGGYYFAISRLTILLHSSSVCRYMCLALVASSVAMRKFMFSPKGPVAMIGSMAQDSSVFQGLSSRQCLSSAFGAVFLALLAVEDLVFLLASEGKWNGVHEAYEFSLDLESLLDSLINCSHLILALVVVTIGLVFIWASIAICWECIVHVCISSSFYGDLRLYYQ